MIYSFKVFILLLLITDSIHEADNTGVDSACHGKTHLSHEMSRVTRACARKDKRAVVKHACEQSAAGDERLKVKR